MTSVQSGINMLLKIKQNSTYQSVAGLRSREIFLNQKAVDITDSDAENQWQALLDTGTKSLRIKGEGIFRNEASAKLVYNQFFDNDINDWQIILPNTLEITAKFLLTELSYAGRYDSEVTWRMSLQSASSVDYRTLP